MNNHYTDEPVIEAYVYEMIQILESLEHTIIQSEKTRVLSDNSINEIFKYMHTINSSSAMLMYNSITDLAHIVENLFYIIRQNPVVAYNFDDLAGIVLASVDFFKAEVASIRHSKVAEGNNITLMASVQTMIDNLCVDGNPIEHIIPDTDQKYYIRPSDEPAEVNCFKATIKFDAGCEMENIRAYTLVQNVMELSELAYYWPNDILDNENSASLIRDVGFNIIIQTQMSLEAVEAFYNSTIFLDGLDIQEISFEEFTSISMAYQAEPLSEDIKKPITLIEADEIPIEVVSNKSMISVHVDKLDSLMDMVGELVVAEAMVTQNPEVGKHEIESFQKSSRLLRKITSNIQDMVMAIRMVPLSTTFLKMNRIVRDMNRKLGKSIVLDIAGEETEMDKNIIDKISDPLMHIIRNAIDHGIEDETRRTAKGKSSQGRITLEAKNSASDVLIIIKDDGRGLNKTEIFNKAFANGLIDKSMDEMTENEIFNLIFLPGFSTKDAATEYSGRGVGLDVVSKNLIDVGGSIIIRSEYGLGTEITLKIPLTLAIIEGMNVKIGSSRFTIPIMSIQESFRPEKGRVFSDMNGTEMIMVRDICYPVLRLHNYYGIETAIKAVDEGILIMVEENDYKCCLFADELLGQQQVVVKALPNYIKQQKRIGGLSGCTLLGDGSISLILDVGDLNKSIRHENRQVN